MKKKKPFEEEENVLIKNFVLSEISEVMEDLHPNANEYKQKDFQTVGFLRDK